MLDSYLEHLEIITDKELINPIDVFKIFWHAEWTKNRRVEDVENMMKNTGIVVLIKYKKKPIAFARAITDFVFRAYIEDVIVLPKHQKHGIGTLLVETLENILKLSGVNRIELTTNKVYFWQSLGYNIKNNTEHLIKNL